MALLAAVSMAAGGATAWLLVRGAGYPPETLSRVARWGPFTAPDPPASAGKDYLDAAAARLAARISRPSFTRVFLTNFAIATIFGFVLPMLAHVAARKGWDPRRHAVVLRTCLLALPAAGMMIQLSRGTFLLSCVRLSQAALPSNLLVYGTLEIAALIVVVSLPYGYYREHASPALADGNPVLSYPEYLWQQRWIVVLCVAAFALAALIETVFPRW